MIDVKEIYKDDIREWESEFGRHVYVSDYQPMIDAFGKVLLQVDDDDYQGDTRVLLAKDGKIGHLIFGWGSCSGCDALQACFTVEEVQELCNELENEIRWFDTQEEALKWFKEHDWEGDWSYHDENTKKYVVLALALLSTGKIEVLKNDKT